MEPPALVAAPPAALPPGALPPGAVLGATPPPGLAGRKAVVVRRGSAAVGGTPSDAGPGTPVTLGQPEGGSPRVVRRMSGPPPAELLAAMAASGRRPPVHVAGSQPPSLGGSFLAGSAGGTPPRSTGSGSMAQVLGPPESEADVTASTATSPRRQGTPVAEHPTPEQRRELFQRRLARWLQAYAPEKVPNVPALAAKYAGHERKVFDFLETKYGPEPAATPLAPMAAPAQAHAAAPAPTVEAVPVAAPLEPAPALAAPSATPPTVVKPKTKYGHLMVDSDDDDDDEEEPKAPVAAPPQESLVVPPPAVALAVAPPPEAPAAEPPVAAPTASTPPASRRSSVLGPQVQAHRGTADSDADSDDDSDAGKVAQQEPRTPQGPGAALSTGTTLSEHSGTSPSSSPAHSPAAPGRTGSSRSSLASSASSSTASSSASSSSSSSTCSSSSPSPSPSPVRTPVASPITHDRSEATPTAVPAFGSHDRSSSGRPEKDHHAVHAAHNASRRKSLCDTATQTAPRPKPASRPQPRPSRFAAAYHRTPEEPVDHWAERVAAAASPARAGTEPPLSLTPLRRVPGRVSGRPPGAHAAAPVPHHSQPPATHHPLSQRASPARPDPRPQPRHARAPSRDASPARPTSAPRPGSGSQRQTASPQWQSPHRAQQQRATSARRSSLTPERRASPLVIDRRTFSPNLRAPAVPASTFGGRGARSRVDMDRGSLPRDALHYAATAGARDADGTGLFAVAAVEADELRPLPYAHYDTFRTKEAGRPNAWALAKGHTVFDAPAADRFADVLVLRSVPHGPEAVDAQRAACDRLSKPRRVRAKVLPREPRHGPRSASPGPR